MVTLLQFKKGFANYLEKEIALKSSGLVKFGVYFLLPQIHSMIDTKLDKYKDYLLVYFDNNKNLDLEAFYRDTKSAMQKVSELEIYGFKFTEKDIDILYNEIKRV
jgi:hypothetical protein